MIGIHEDFRKIDPKTLIGSTIRWYSWEEDKTFVLESFLGETLFGKYHSDLYPGGTKKSFSMLNGITRRKCDYSKAWYLVKDMRDKKFNLKEDLFEL